MTIGIQKGRDRKFIAAVIVACLYVILWLFFLYAFGFGGKLPFSLAGNWEHANALFNLLTSIGYAAIGVLLGTKVEKANTEAAKGHVKQLSSTASGALEAAQALATTPEHTSFARQVDDLPAQNRLRDAIAQADAWLARHPS